MFCSFYSFALLYIIASIYMYALLDMKIHGYIDANARLLSFSCTFRSTSTNLNIMFRCPPSILLRIQRLLFGSSLFQNA